MAEQLAPLEVIERTRRGEHVDAASVESFVRSWIDRTTDDSLMAAWCMAACLTGIGREQVEALTRVLIASGDRLELATLGPTGDVQSTGGVGDTAPIVAAPLAAALGVRVATMGGRGLGHAAGTIDKLEAIPGFEADLPLARFVRQVRDTGIAVVSQSARLTPAGRRLEALRDATGTTPAPGLVAAAVMSRAITGGAGAVCLEVTHGAGAYLADAGEAEAAAALMASLAVPWGRHVRWTAAAMDVPQGRSIGNALEVREAAEVLRGGGPDDVRQLAVALAGGLAEAAGVVAEGEGTAQAGAALRDGRALVSAERWVEAQGGDAAVWSDPEALPMAPVRIDVTAPVAGRIAAMPARVLGEVARWLGAGRLHPDQSIDPVAGIELRAVLGERVGEGDPIAVIHARDDWAGERARAMAAECIVVSEEPAAAGEGGGGDA
jgi:pyrimidine-nucleoside phosphorylase